MSTSDEIQKALYERLTAFPALAGVPVLDGPPADTPFPYITFGPCDVQEDDADCIDGEIHTQQIDVWTSSQGQTLSAKVLCDHVKAALHKYDTDLGSVALCFMRVVSRRIISEPDGIGMHGIVNVQISVEI